jgi:cellulose synthase/poly-beta-1,6-N-acetylglucosamine synthase-like glycosyltransferase
MVGAGALPRAIDVLILVYGVALVASQGLLFAASVHVHRWRAAVVAPSIERTRRGRAPGIAIVVPARNEEAGIVQSVRSLLSSAYPNLEVIVVDDGSTDGTHAALAEAYELGPPEPPPPSSIALRGSIHAVHRSAIHPLVVVSKAAGGSRADAVNAGIVVAQLPLLCFVDADSVIEHHALLHLAEPFVRAPGRTVAVGGSVRIVNGSDVRNGEVVHARSPKNLIARIQAVEYLRAFLCARAGWSRIGGLMLISGAFGLYRRDVVLAVGGLDPDSLGEDMDLTLRVHQLCVDDGRPYSIEQAAEAVCWTEGPHRIRDLATQRCRWAQGAVEVLRDHRDLLGRQARAVGMISLPWFMVFELLAPFIEIGGMALIAFALVTGAAQPERVVLITAVALWWAVLSSCAAVLLEQIHQRRYTDRRDILSLAVAIVIEPILYRPMTLVWRVRGTARALRGTRSEWGSISRAGIGATTALTPAGSSAV